MPPQLLSFELRSWSRSCGTGPGTGAGATQKTAAQQRPEGCRYKRSLAGATTRRRRIADTTPPRTPSGHADPLASTLPATAAVSVIALCQFQLFTARREQRQFFPAQNLLPAGSRRPGSPGRRGRILPEPLYGHCCSGRRRDTQPLPPVDRIGIQRSANNRMSRTTAAGDHHIVPPSSSATTTLLTAELLSSSSPTSASSGKPAGRLSCDR